MIAETERGLLDAVMALARYNNWLCYHTFRSEKSAPGFPDICMVREHRLVLAELKTLTGHVTPAQQQWLDALMQVRRVEVYIWRPPDFAQVERLLQRGYRRA
jgi:hypothetical protein